MREIAGTRVATEDGAVRRPYPGLAERRRRELLERQSAIPPVTSPHAGAPAAVHRRLRERIAALHEALCAFSLDLHAHPELAYEEHHAAAALADLVGRYGVAAEVGAYGVPTAVRAVVGTGSPRVAVVAEYDALPGIGHACGHNVIAASSAGAFLALAELLAGQDAPAGAVELVGTPAEEGGGGKQRVLDAGGFDEIDFAIMVHPGNLDLAGGRSLGFRQVAVTYHGLAAHASTAPHLGVNALDAVVAAYNGIAQLRQHILPSDRVHGIITDGGQAPNIVPAKASAVFYVRSAELDTLAELHTRVDAILRAAALSTGTRAEITWDAAAPYLPLRPNEPLEARYAVHLADRRRVLPGSARPVETAASTDMGNVSVYVPAIHPSVAIAPPDVANHTPEFAAYAASESATTGIRDAAIGIASTVADFLYDERLRADARADFEARGGRLTLADALNPVKETP
ncbi:M20 family metallopeptidase [Thermasporomyces composti]|uniref:Peptidase M20 domain-containing protein 2 n=1 Tax=Thermasporomyces composti TaxID=696763 RepID=A0A3D9V9B6_THECX|nr:M20 family metallopeptidase [Thermasporomyces composti]REF36750.1 amidohydrolase [Thermasporomyces composti]